MTSHSPLLIQRLDEVDQRVVNLDLLPADEDRSRDPDGVKPRVAVTSSLVEQARCLVVGTEAEHQLREALGLRLVFSSLRQNGRDPLSPALGNDVNILKFRKRRFLQLGRGPG